MNTEPLLLVPDHQCVAPMLVHEEPKSELSMVGLGN